MILQPLARVARLLDDDQREAAEIIEIVMTEEGIPREMVAAAIVNAMAESGLDPEAMGDWSTRKRRHQSIGLFQLHERGHGHGMSVQERMDPEANTLRIISVLKGSMGRPLWKAWQAGERDIPRLTALFTKHIERPLHLEEDMEERARYARLMFPATAPVAVASYQLPATSRFAEQESAMYGAMDPYGRIYKIIGAVPGADAEAREAMTLFATELDEREIPEPLAEALLLGEYVAGLFDPATSLPGDLERRASELQVGLHLGGREHLLRPTFMEQSLSDRAFTVTGAFYDVDIAVKAQALAKQLEGSSFGGMGSVAEMIYQNRYGW